MYRLTVRDTFDSAHRLRKHKGKCSEVHGHTWHVEVEVSARQLGNAGMVVDFADIKAALRSVIADLDHTMLNDLPSFRIVEPTAENIAVVIMRRLQSQLRGVSAVTVRETPTAEVRFEVEAEE